MVNTKIFFFELDDDYVLYNYVLDDYVLRGNTDYIFDISSIYKQFSFEDSTSNKVFVESHITNKWDYEDDIIYSIFDDNELYRAITTETDEDLLCEDGSTVLIW